MATAVMPMPGLPTPNNGSSTPIATASGLLALLSEPDPLLVSHALTKLLAVVDTLWHEVAESLPDLESIAEGSPLGSADDADDDDNNNVAMATTSDEVYDVATRKTAAALASRVFFHLEEPRQALRLALESGEEYFNVLTPSSKDGAYVERLVNAAIGEYVARKQKEFDGEEGVGGGTNKKEGEEDEEEEELDMEKLQHVVHLMFQRCYTDGSYGHALGVAFEAREGDKVAEILTKLSSSDSGLEASTVVETLKYAMSSAHNLIPSKSFRGETLCLIADSLNKVFTSETSSESAKRNAACALVLCRQLLGDASAVGEIIVQLIDGGASSSMEESNDDSALLGLQLCFDIVDSGDQAFVNKVATCLPKQQGEGASVVEGSTEAEGESKVEVDESGTPTSPSAANESSVEVETKSRTEGIWTHFMNAHRILTGGFTSELALSFLYKNSNSDGLIMANLKKALEERSMSRNSVLHNCAVTAHGYLNSGTTNDAFLRDNLDWMKKASNWYVCHDRIDVWSLRHVLRAPH